MKFRYDTYCGLYCGACPVLIANKKGTLEDAAHEWEMNPDDITCHGCKTDIISVYCKTCDIKECTENKKIEFCIDCKEYPCDRLTAFRNDECPHHSVIFKNLGVIHKKGVDTWLDKQEKRWKCPHCGERYAWYDTVCKKCGNTLHNCEEEERDLKE